jgi:hypothetical protein
MSGSVERDTVPQDGDLDELVARVEAHEDELVDLLDLLVATKGLSEELQPELSETSIEYREAIDDLRVTFEREETVALVRSVGENAGDLVELLELLDATKDLAEDLAPELQESALEAREPIDKVRAAFEDQEPLVLLQKLGENTNTLIDLLDLLEATERLLADLKPEMEDAALASRDSFDQLRLLGAGFTDGYSEYDTDPHQLGQNLARMLVLAERIGDPELVDAVDSGLSAFTDDQPAPKRGLWGTLKAFRDEDVQQGLGTLVEFLKRVGKSRRS